MADFSLTTVFVMPTSQNGVIRNGIQTTDLLPGEIGIFNPSYVSTNAPASSLEYIYVAQGRANTYLQGTKRSDKIGNCCGKIVNWYTIEGCPTPQNQITDISDWNVKCGEIVTVTLRGHSSYIDTLYFNGFTRSVTVQAPCCDCGADPCTQVDAEALVTQIIDKLEASAPGINPDNISFNTFYTFSQPVAGTLRIEGKALTSYGQPCDVAAFPYEYDRLWFRAFAYKGPATTADFIVADACDVVATVTKIQDSNYAAGTYAEIFQLEKDYYSYQAGYLKHLYRMGGYNYNFESYAEQGVTYDTYYLTFKPSKEQWTWGDYIIEDARIIVAIPTGGDSAAFKAAMTSYLGAPEGASGELDGDCPQPTTVAPTTTPAPIQ